MNQNPRDISNFIGLTFSIPPNPTWNVSDYAGIIAEATRYNTYFETIKIDWLPGPDITHMRIHDTDTHGLHKNFLSLTEKQMRNLKKKPVILILDETHEPFYGKSFTPWIHPYKPKKGCTGSYKLLVASILAGDTRYFLDAVPLNLFSDRDKKIEEILDRLRELNIKVVLLDRGLSCSSVIRVLKARKLRYLGLFKKYGNVKAILRSIRSSYLRTPLEVNGVETNLVIVRDERFDWTFVTDLKFKDFVEYVQVYRLRWNIETGFRVHDEARIKTKCVDIDVRYFLFLIGLLLYNIWKDLPEDMPFKRFLIYRTYQRLRIPVIRESFVHT